MVFCDRLWVVLLAQVFGDAAPCILLIWQRCASSRTDAVLWHLTYAVPWCLCSAHCAFELPYLPTVCRYCCWDSGCVELCRLAYILRQQPAYFRWEAGMYLATNAIIDTQIQITHAPLAIIQTWVDAWCPHNVELVTAYLLCGAGSKTACTRVCTSLCKSMTPCWSILIIRLPNVGRSRPRHFCETKLTYYPGAICSRQSCSKLFLTLNMPAAHHLKHRNA